MRFPEFSMERMQSTWEHHVKYDLSESGLEALTLEDAVRDLGLLAKERLGYANGMGRDQTRAAVASFHPEATKDNVLITTGTSEANFLAFATLVEPGGYSTDWGGASAKRADQLPEYDDVRAKVAQWRAQRMSSPGDPVATRDAILAVVDADQPPLRIFFGDAGLDMTTAEYERRLATWQEWHPVSVAAHG